jgi:diguanylate cyclase (GGDEF)-like protein
MYINPSSLVKVSLRLLLFGLIVCTGVAQIWFMLPNIADQQPLVSNFMSLPSFFLASVICFIVGFYKSFLRRTWWFFAAALLLNFIGDLSWTIIELFLQQDPYPSIADFFYLSAYFLIYLGLFSFPQKKLELAHVIQLLLQVGMITAATGTFLWHFIFAQIVTNKQPTLNFIVSLAYPLADVILLAMVLFVAFRPDGKRFKTEFNWLLLAFFSSILIDLYFSYLSAYDLESTVSIFDGGWGWFACFVGIAAYQNLNKLKTPEILHTNLAVFHSSMTISVPFFISFTAIILLVVTGQQNSLQYQGTGLGVLLVLGFVMVRLVLMTLDNQNLNRQLLDSAIEREARSKQLEWNANHDALTGLANRVLLQKELQNNLLENQVAVLLIDLDGFKRINDTLGHQIGDYLLCEVAKRLMALCPLVARTGGDEFVMVCLEKTMAGSLAKAALHSLEEPFLVSNQQFSISASIGISQSPEDGTNSEILQRHADAAMYVAKNQGVGHIEHFTIAIKQQLDRRFELEQNLRHALENHEFHLQYQPIIDSQTNKLDSLETLLRWTSPKLGRVSPSEFIPVTEETGLIAGLTQWVIEQVCQQIQTWKSLDLEIVPISINIPMAQVGQLTFTQLIKQKLEQYQIAAQYLQIELLEAALAQPNVAEQLKAFRQMGIKISIDDFGTGYSNLSYFNQLPIDTIKIDQNFIQQTSSYTILEGLTAFCKHLNFRVVVEGVETQAQLEQLKLLHCQGIQGHIFAAPADPEAAISWLISPDFSMVDKPRL